MSPEEKAAEIDATLKADKARQDAEERDAGEKLDKVLAHLDSLGKRMDAFEEADGDDDQEDEEMNREPGEPRPLAADSVRAMDDRRRRGESEREFNQRIANERADAQVRADAVASAFGMKAPRPMDGEDVRAYRVRLLKNFRHNSPDYKDVPIEQIAHLPPAMFDVAQARIYADSPGLFAPWFPGASWDPWRVILRAAFALPMSDAERGRRCQRDTAGVAGLSPRGPKNGSLGETGKRVFRRAADLDVSVFRADPEGCEFSPSSLGRQLRFPPRFALRLLRYDSTARPRGIWATMYLTDTVGRYDCQNDRLAQHFLPHYSI
jgi:hypothetical protein